MILDRIMSVAIGYHLECSMQALDFLGCYRVLSVYVVPCHNRVVKLESCLYSLRRLVGAL